MLFKLMTLVHLCAAFPLKCPEEAQWRLRANSHCADSSKYSCLWDDNIKEYSENCTRFDFQNAGRKSVLRGGIDANECSKERYQPSGYTLYTNASTNCILLKSFCNEEGQVVYDHGNRTTDATCICNYRRGFAFLIKPNNPCYCKPSQEDCSCFLKICSNSSHILSPDYKCTIDSDLTPVSNGRAITDENDNNGRRPNITETFPREDNYVTVPWRKRSAIAVSSIFGCTMVMLLLLWMKRVRGHCTQCCIREIFTSEFIPISCIEGERLQLKCSVYSKDIFVKWMKDDMEIEQSENLSIYIDGKDHFLIVQQAKLSDSGQYFMIAGNVEKQQTVTIKAMFTSTLDPIKCIEGEKLQLKCSVYLEHVSVEWFKADVRFNENENISIENDGIHHCMTIQQAKLSDDGQYDISAGNVRKQVTVHVQAMFTSELDPIKCIEGEKLQLKCSVFLEDASVEWLKGDVRINENENISIECDGMHHCMTIIPAKLSDDGQYDIVAGNVRKQVRVNVQAMFTSGFKQKYCIEGEMLQLTCSVISHIFHVDWFKDDEKIKQNHNIMINRDGMHHCLTIQQAKLSDAGQYIMTVGNVSKQLKVIIKGRTKLEEAKQEKESSQKKALCNWKLLKEILASINIEDVSKQIVGKDIWERIKHNSRRSQLETILRTAIKNIQTSADYDQFEAKVFNFNSNFRLLTPNNNLFPVDMMANQLLPANTELIENELYPKDHIDSFLEWLIFSLIEHEELRNMENVREKMANSFLTKIQLPNYIKKGSMHCLIDCFRQDHNKVLNRISELMDSALSNGSSNFTGDNTLKKIMETRNFCRHSIICKWTYLKENFDPLDIIVNLYRCGLVDEDRAEIMRRKSRREMVDLTLRNIVRRIDGQIMLSKLKHILKEVNLSLTDEQQDIAERNRFGKENNCDVENVKSRLQTLENDLETQFDPNFIDTFLENNVFDIDDHENIWEAGSGERGKCFYEKISDIEYIKKGSIKCLAYCLENSEDSPVIKKLLAGLLTSDEMPEQEIKRTETHIEIGTEIMYSRSTNTLTQARITIKTDPGIENGMFEGANSEKINKTISGLQMEIKDTERSSVIFHLQSSDGENVKLVFEKGISNGNLTSFIKNLLNDENVKKHMSPDKRYNLSVSIHSEDQQTQLCSDHDKLKMRIIKANRKLLEEEYDPMSLLKALFDGNQGNYKSLKNLSLEDVADFKQKFSEINKIPERRKRVKQFLNIAEDMIEADKLWELIEDTANTFSMKKMQHDLKSEQNYNSSSDEGLIFEGKYEVWKTEEDIKSPLQSFILQENKKRGHQHEDRMSYNDFDSPEDNCLPGMKNAEAEVLKGKGDEIVSDQLDEEIKTGLDYLQLQRKTEEPDCGSVYKTEETVQKPEVSVVQIQQTVHKSEVPMNKTQEYANKPEELEQSVNIPQEKFYEERYQSQVAMERQTSQNDPSMFTVSQEEENHLRMNLLLLKIAPRAVRVLFDMEFHPTMLHASLRKSANKLIDLKKKRRINQSQWDLLFPSRGIPDSKTFDVTLMITLLTNLVGLNNYNILPLVTDISPASDLARIKYHRNYISNNKDGKINNSSFSLAWDDIIQAVGRLGGNNMLDECKELRRINLGQSTVPWNIRVQINHLLEEWKNINFIETLAAKHVLERVHENSCVTITGSFGVGKTATLRHVALTMIEDEYNVLLITNPHDIIKFYNPNQKTLFVIDDLFGTFSLNEADHHSWKPVMSRIRELLQNKFTKIIVACRLQVYKDYKFKALSIFNTCVCNLLSEDFCLSQTEKMLISELYLQAKAAEIVQYCDLYDCFPLLCKLYNENPTLSINDFFKNPFLVYGSEIEKLIENGYYRKYCVLALLVIFNNRLHEECLTEEVNTEVRTMIENTCEACRLERATSRLILLDEFETLEDTFITKTQGIYKTIHNKIFDFLSFYFGQKMIQCLIRNGDSKLIKQRFLLERRDDMDQFITIVPLQYHQMYIQRLIYDWSEGMIHCVFNNINMKIPVFRERFLGFLNTLDISFQKQLVLTCDVKNKDTVLLQCCQYDDIPLIQWCIYHGIDVNQCNFKGVSPLYVSAQEGYIDLVKILLNNNANIDKCTDDGASPLFVACQKNHKEIVKLLLDEKAVIDKGMDDATSPLLIAKKMNHIYIVRMLEENGASE